MSLYRIKNKDNSKKKKNNLQFCHSQVSYIAGILDTH